MKQAYIKKSEFSGTVAAPPSKSAAHRFLICAALSKGVSVLSPFDMSEDMKATIGALTALGAKFEINGNQVTVDGRGMFSKINAEIDCIESGSTLRFMIPIAAAGGIKARFTGRGRLPKRPLNVFYDILPQKGVRMSDSHLPLTIEGSLKSGVYEVAGNVSSQFITGLLLSLPLLSGESEIILTTALESSDYIEMTLNAMSEFGVKVIKTKFGYKIPGSQTYSPGNYNIEGDWSQAAFFLCAGVLNGDVTVTGINADSLQGDKKIVDILRQLGADIEVMPGAVRAKKSRLFGGEIDMSDIPDLLPVLAVTSAFGKGETLFYHAARVRIKESDRIDTSAAGLSNMGIKTVQTPDSLRVFGGVPGFGTIDGADDHRIVMAFAAGAGCAQGAIIAKAEAINKSYPDFFKDFVALGGRCELK